MEKSFIKKISFVFMFLITVLLLTNTIFATTTYTSDEDAIFLDATTYNYQPSPINSGDTFEMWVQLKNISNNEATNVEYVLEPSYPFSILESGKEVGTINSIAPYQSKVIKFELKADYQASGGSYEIVFKHKRDGLDIYNIQKYYLDVSSKKAIIDIVDTVIEPVRIGSKSNISLDIKNLSNRDARDIFVTLNDSEDEYIKTLNIKTKYIENLSANQQTNISFDIIVDRYTTNKTYTLPITISYKDYEGEYSISRYVGFEIIDNPEILLTVQNVGTNFTLKPNSEEEIDLEIYNLGNVDAEGLYVEITSPGIERSVRYFIGTLEKDNYDNLELKFNTKDISDKEQITINIIYKNSNLEEITISETIDVNVAKTSTSFSIMTLFSSLFSIVGLIVGIAIFIIIFKWLYKIIIKPAYKDLFSLFRKKRK